MFADSVNEVFTAPAIYKVAIYKIAVLNSLHEHSKKNVLYLTFSQKRACCVGIFYTVVFKIWIINLEDNLSNAENYFAECAEIISIANIVGKQMWKFKY